ncbi:dopaminechrome tautomerase-like [Periplaneta americana]|uniref:dopaminechrome tautomerase-like n=1 Tax=Periplaneta americana TaxID=6978 RepID=UPI0037E71DA2
MAVGRLAVLGCVLLCTALFVSASVLDVVFEWKEVDFAYPSGAARQEAIRNRMFVPGNNVPVGLEVWNNKLFVTVPRWKTGVPASLAYVYLNETGNKSPRLIPYPNWDSHNIFLDIIPRFGQDNRNVTRIVSPFRMRADACDRLWVLDTGKADILGNEEQIGPNQLLVYNLNNDELVLRYEIPSHFMKNGSFLANIAVDVKASSCSNAFAYLADLGTSSMVVYSMLENKAWRVTHPYFQVDPNAINYRVAGISFQWEDGLFGLALSSEQEDGFRMLYFHPFSSFNEYSVSTKVLRNESLWKDAQPLGESRDEFKLLGSRGSDTQSCASFLDEKTGILFYAQVTRNAVGCWNSRHTYNPATQGEVAVDNVTMVFPNDIKVDAQRNLWVLTDRMPLFTHNVMNYSDFNFRVLTAPVDKAVAHTVCARETSNAGCSYTPLGFALVLLISCICQKFLL